MKGWWRLLTKRRADGKGRPGKAWGPMAGRVLREPEGSTAYTELGARRPRLRAGRGAVPTTPGHPCSPTVAHARSSTFGITTLSSLCPARHPREDFANPSFTYLRPPAPTRHLRHPTLTSWNPRGGLDAPTRMHKSRSHFRPSGRPGGYNPPRSVPMGRAILYGSR